MDCNVIIVTGHSKLDSGGVGTHLKLLISELDKRGLLLDVVLGSTLQGKAFHFFVRLFSRIFKYKHLPNSLYPIANIYFIKKKLSKSLLKLNSQSQKIIIHTHDRSSTIAAYLLRERFNIKIIQTVHAPFYQQYEIHPEISKSLVPFFIRGLDYSTVNFAYSYIAVDNLQKSLMMRDFGDQVDDSSVAVISNAVEAELLDYKSEKTNRKFFLVSRHLHEKNGVEYSIRAFKLFKDICASSSSVELLILGQGPLEYVLRKLVDDLGLSESVIFLGSMKREECIELTSQAICSIVPSIPVGDYIEATSLSMLEALALGTPLIASNIGGIKQVLDNKNSAFLVEPKDIQAISQAMCSIFNSDEKVNSFVDKGKKLVREEYIVSKWTDKIIECYER